VRGMDRGRCFAFMMAFTGWGRSAELVFYFLITPVTHAFPGGKGGEGGGAFVFRFLHFFFLSCIHVVAGCLVFACRYIPNSYE
jgi:hypothetical protein